LPRRLTPPPPHFRRFRRHFSAIFRHFQAIAVFFSFYFAIADAALSASAERCRRADYASRQIAFDAITRCRYADTPPVF